MSKKNKSKYIITSGPTREFIDPIRFLSNPSTGKMGFYIAKAAINQGYKTTYICGPASQAFSKVPKAKNISIISTQEMLTAVLEELEENSVLVMAAAPADYCPEKRYGKKIKKEENSFIKLLPNPDILKETNQYAKEKNMKLTLIGFAAETHNVEEYALKKLKEKNLDIIFVNDLSQKNSGFGSDMNSLTVFKKDNIHKKWGADLKERLAYKIIEETKKLSKFKES